MMEKTGVQRALGAVFFTCIDEFSLNETRWFLWFLWFLWFRDALVPRARRRRQRSAVVRVQLQFGREYALHAALRRL